MMTLTLSFPRKWRNESAVPQSSFSGICTGEKASFTPPAPLTSWLRTSSTGRYSPSLTTTTASVSVHTSGPDVPVHVHAADSPRNPILSSNCTGYHMSGLLATGSRHLGQSSVSGYIREPRPAAMITARQFCMALTVLISAHLHVSSR